MKKNFIVASVVLFFLALGAGAIIFTYDKVMYPLRYQSEILSAANEFNVDASLIASVINTESRFRKNAVSSKGAVGLMQVKPSTAEWVAKQLIQINSERQFASANQHNNVGMQKIMYDEKTKTGELLDPATNIRIGTFYLSYLLNKFNNNLHIVLCAYNAGEGTVRNWLTNPDYSVDKINLHKIPYKETSDYIKKIKLNLKVYTKKTSEIEKYS